MTQPVTKQDAPPTPGRDCRPGTGRFESDENGLVVERFANGECSFDIFDALDWPSGDDDGIFYARLIVDTAAERDRLVAANAELASALGYADLQLRGYGQIDPKVRAALKAHDLAKELTP